jgi:hypothetical protein
VDLIGAWRFGRLMKPKSQRGEQAIHLLDSKIPNRRLSAHDFTLANATGT